MSDSSASSGSNLKKEFATDRLLGGVFLFTVAGFSLLFGFGRTFAASKKHEKILDTSVINRIEGNSLAMRALGWGSLIAVTGVGAICYGIWKATGASNKEEFRQIVGNLLPRITRNETSGRSEFKNLTELFQYIMDEDNRAKEQKPTKRVNIQDSQVTKD